MAGSKNLVDKVANRDIVSKMVLESTPTALRNMLSFVKENFEGVEDCDQFDRDGNVIDTMSKSSIAKMNLAHRISHKIFDKAMPSVHIFEDETRGQQESMSKEVQDAIVYLAKESRKRLVSEDNVIDVTEATEIRNNSRGQ